MMKDRNMIIKKIAVLKGGWSLEREISLQSGKNVADGLRSLGFDVFEIDIRKDLMYITNELYKINPDYIFNMLHGTGGEDGIIQGVLEIFGTPYSNSNTLSSSICFNKFVAKQIVKSCGVNIIPGVRIYKDNLKNIDLDNPDIPYPFVIKPTENGSSVGVFLVFDKNDMKNIINKDWTFGDEIIIEKYIKGREFTVSVLDGNAMGSVEIVYNNKFYDFDAKYSDGGSRHLQDFDMIEEHKNKMMRMAEDVYKACYCKGIARVDFIYDQNEVFFLEINTQPGMTKTSLVPDIAKNKGISFENILLKMMGL